MANIPAVSRITALSKHGFVTLIGCIAFGAVMGLMPFLLARTWDWTRALIFAAVTLAGWTALGFVLAQTNPQGIHEQGMWKPRAFLTKLWDVAFVAAHTGLLLLTPFIAGYDYRYWLTRRESIPMNAIGIAIYAVGIGLLLWAAYTSRAVETAIDGADEQHVITAGPYRYVRHPHAVAYIIQFVGIPLTLGSKYSLLPACAGILVFIVHTTLVDRALQRHLAGYTDFARQTRSRLFPGIW